MSDELEKEGAFLSRWSRQKTSDREEQRVKEDALTEPAEAMLPTAPPDEEEINPEDLPDLESLDENSDYTVFMKKGVPEELKRLALRKLFLNDPALSVLDGLNDYDEDYSMIGKVVEEVTTRYKAGKGMVDPEEEKAVEQDDAEDSEDLHQIEDQEDAEIIEDFDADAPTEIVDEEGLMAEIIEDDEITDTIET